MQIQKRNHKPWMQRLSVMSSLLGLLTLGGCASTGAPPKCPDSTGLQCARVDQINRQIDNVLSGNSLAARGQGNSLSSAPVPRWQRDRVMPVWFAPYTDAAGNYREASVIDANFPPGQWKNNATKTI